VAIDAVRAVQPDQGIRLHRTWDRRQGRLREGVRGKPEDRL